DDSDPGLRGEERGEAAPGERVVADQEDAHPPAAAARCGREGLHGMRTVSPGGACPRFCPPIGRSVLRGPCSVLGSGDRSCVREVGPERTGFVLSYAILSRNRAVLSCVTEPCPGLLDFCPAIEEVCPGIEGFCPGWL